MDQPRRTPLSALLPWIPAAIPALLACAIHIGNIKGLEEPRTSELALMVEAFDLIRRRHVEPVDSRKLAYEAMTGMVGTLDPHSRFFDPEEARLFREGTSGEFGGLGIYISIEHGLITIIAPLDGGPAAQAGIVSGDVILQIDGKEYSFKDSTDAVKALKGEPGTKVRLLIQHKDEATPKELEVPRAIVKVESVRDVRLVDAAAKLGYLRLTAFQEDTLREVSAALLALRKLEVKGLIIDLRSNPGGLLRSATDIADLFLPVGQLIVTTRGRDKVVDQVRSTREPPFGDLLLAVLIDEGSASASEILAGALRDNGRAVLCGARSYGKGSVQSVLTLKDGESILKLTTSYYYTPSGRRIHRPPQAKPEDEWGLKPDLEAPLSTELRRKLNAEQSDRYVRELKRRAGEKPDPKATAVETIDPAVAAACARLKNALAGVEPLVAPAPSEGGKDARPGH